MRGVILALVVFSLLALRPSEAVEKAAAPKVGDRVSLHLSGELGFQYMQRCKTIKNLATDIDTFKKKGIGISVYPQAIDEIDKNGLVHLKLSHTVKVENEPPLMIVITIEADPVRLERDPQSQVADWKLQIDTLSDATIQVWQLKETLGGKMP